MEGCKFIPGTVTALSHHTNHLQVEFFLSILKNVFLLLAAHVGVSLV